MRPDYLLAAATGLLGGFGHCVGMCGPLVAAMSLATGPGDGRRGFAGHLLYNAGRVTTYGFIGAVMGLSGSFVNTAARLAGLQNAVSVVAGLLMVFMGLGAAGLAGWARRLEERAAARVFSAVRSLLEGGGTGRRYALGLLLGFLPCGLSYSAFVGAAATGGPVPGLFFALTFAFGTVPALLLVGGATAWLSGRARGALYRIGGALVAVTGLLFVARGLGLHVAL